MRTVDISNAASICGWVACKSEGILYPEESALRTPLSARTWHQGYLVEQCDSIGLLLYPT